MENSPKLYLLCITLTVLICNICSPCSADHHDASLAVLMDQWPEAMSVYESEEELDGESSSSRRSLWWHRMRYYISYGALSANRVPCPPRSGRSYYTHNCYKASGPVHPYTRGCSAITRCRR